MFGDGTNDSQWYYNLEKMLQVLLKKGVEMVI